MVEYSCVFKFFRRGNVIHNSELLCRINHVTRLLEQENGAKQKVENLFQVSVVVSSKLDRENFCVYISKIAERSFLHMITFSYIYE